MPNGYRLSQFILAFVLIVVMQPAGVNAANVGVAITGGASLTAGSLGHKSDLGYSGSFLISIKPDPTDSPELKLIGRIGYHSFPTDTEQDFTIITAELGLKLDRVFSRSPNMYFAGGGGLAKTDYGFTETSPFVSIGIGVENGHLVLEGRLVRLFGNKIKETTFFPVTLGVRF